MIEYLLFVFFRWLSCYDLAVGTLRLMDAYQICYQAFLPKDMKPTYSAVKLGIFRRRNVSNKARSRINEILDTMSKRPQAADGKARKSRLLKKAVYHVMESFLILNLYSAVLPLMKSYVCLFQSIEPMVHKLHQKQKELFRECSILLCEVGTPDRKQSKRVAAAESK